jgi:hypothetical protein
MTTLPIIALFSTWVINTQIEDISQSIITQSLSKVTLTTKQMKMQINILKMTLTTDWMKMQTKILKTTLTINLGITTNTNTTPKTTLTTDHEKRVNTTIISKIILITD